MKRTCYIIMCVFALFLSAKASAQQLQFETNAEVQQGQTATLNIVMNNSEAMRGFQFDLTMPEGLTPVISKVGDTSHDLTVSKVGENKWRVLSYSLDNAEYSADFGTVVTVSIPVPEDFAVGSYTISVGNAYLSNHDNSKIEVEDFSTNLSILSKYISTESVTLSKKELSLLIGDSAKLTATVSPDNTTDKSATWSSSDASVATVDADGNVTAIAVGTAIITAKFGDVSASCTVIVEKHSQEIVWTQELSEVTIGDVIELTAEATSGLTVAYSIIRGEDLSTLNGNVLTIVKEGEIVVSASQEGNEKYKSADSVTKTMNAINTGISYLLSDDNEVTITNVNGVMVYKGRQPDLKKFANGIYIIQQHDGKKYKVIMNARKELLKKQ